MTIREASVAISKRIEVLFLPWALSCTIFFVALGILIPPAANWLMAGIVTMFSAMQILIFCLIGDYVLRNFSDSDIRIIYSAGSTLGITFGYMGYFVANSIAHFQSSVIAFLAAGFVAGVSVSAKIAANKRMQSDHQKATPFDGG